MYKINKTASLTYIMLRGNYLTKKVFKKISKQTLIFLRAPKHFNIGKHKVSSFVNFKSHLYKVNLTLPTINFIKNKFLFYYLFSTFHKININYSITSIKLNIKTKIKF